MSKSKQEAQTELNFQFLNTISMRAEEFRPERIPGGTPTWRAADAGAAAGEGI